MVVVRSWRHIVPSDGFGGKRLRKPKSNCIKTFRGFALRGSDYSDGNNKVSYLLAQAIEEIGWRSIWCKKT